MVITCFFLILVFVLEYIKALYIMTLLRKFWHFRDKALYIDKNALSLLHINFFYRNNYIILQKLYL